MEIIQQMLTIVSLGSIGLAVWRDWRWCRDVGAFWPRLVRGIWVLLKKEGAVINILAMLPGVYIRAVVGFSLEAIRAQSLTAKALRCIIAPGAYLFLLAVVLKHSPCTLVWATRAQTAILRGLVTWLKMMPRVVAAKRRFKTFERGT